MIPWIEYTKLKYEFFVHDFCAFLCSRGERMSRELSCRVIHVVVGVIRKIKMARSTLLGDVESENPRQFDSPEQIFHRGVSLDAAVQAVQKLRITVL